MLPLNVSYRFISICLSLVIIRFTCLCLHPCLSTSWCICNCCFPCCGAVSDSDGEDQAPAAATEAAVAAPEAAAGEAAATTMLPSVDSEACGATVVLSSRTSPGPPPTGAPGGLQGPQGPAAAEGSPGQVAAAAGTTGSTSRACDEEHGTLQRWSQSDAFGL